MKVTRSARKTLRTGARWKKGQSSSSNPRCVRFRLAAAAGGAAAAAAANSGGSGFTAEQLRKFNHQQQQMSSDNDDDDDDANSEATWATNFTGCTNQCFGQVIANWSARQNTERRRLTLAVLAAVTEIIQQRGGTESNEEYLQALVTALASLDKELQQAAAYLLSVLLQRTEQHSVAAAFPAIASVCQQLLANLPANGNDGADRGTDSSDTSSSSSSLTKSLLICLGRSLSCLKRSDWHSAATRQALQSLLLFSLSTKPRVRKAAVQAAADAVTGCQGFTTPGAQVVAFASERAQDPATAVASLRLLAACAAAFGDKQARTIVECLLNLLPMSDARVFGQSMLTLRALIWQWPNRGRRRQKQQQQHLSSQLLGQTLTAMYDARPSFDDAASCNTWLDTMRAGVTALAAIYIQQGADHDGDEDGGGDDDEDKRVVEQMLSSHLMKLFSTAFNALPQCRQETRHCIATVCHHLITDSLPKLNQPLENADAMFDILQSGLSYQFRDAWSQVTHLLAALFRCYGNECETKAGNCVQQLGLLLDSSEDHEATGCLQKSLIAAIETLGARRILAWVPLNLDASGGSGDLQLDNWARSWLVPLLRMHIRNTELMVFVQQLLPLADAAAAAAAASSSSSVKQQQLKLLELQLWDLLPAFCTQPTDICTAVPKLAKRIGLMLQQRHDLRPVLMSALRKLIISVTPGHDDNHNDGGEVDMKARQLISSFAKNYLPRLFSIYCCTEDGSSVGDRLPALETVRCYAAIAPKQLLLELFDKLRHRIEGNSDKLDCQLSADLIIAIGPHLPVVQHSTALGTLLSLCTNWCSSSGVLQKKGYRLLQQLLESQRAREQQQQQQQQQLYEAENDDESLKAMKAALRETIPSLLHSSQACVLASSRKSRLRCLILVLDADWLDADLPAKRQLVEWALPEAVLATVEQNSKARETADTLICHIFQFFINQQQQGQDESAANTAAERFLTIIFTSTAGSEQSAIAALHAVSGLIPHLKLLITQPMLQLLVEHVMQTMQNNNSSRLLVKACVRCVVSIARRLSHVYSLEQMCRCLTALNPDLRLAFRSSIRRIITKLYATFPYDVLKSSMPDYCQKVLVNVRKRSEYRERRKGAGGDGEDDNGSQASYHTAMTRVVKGIDELLASSCDTSSEEDNSKKKLDSRSLATTSRRRRKLAAKGERAWIEEEAGTVLDLNDAAAAAKIHRSKPLGLGKVRSADNNSRAGNGFRLANDGRMIIEDEEDDEDDDAGDNHGKQHGAKKQRRAESKSMRDDDADSDYSDVDSDSDQQSGKRLQYKPGGRGIHRPLGPDAAAAAAAKHQQKQQLVKRDKKVKKKAKSSASGIEPYSFVTMDRRLLSKKNKIGQKKQLLNYKQLVCKGKVSKAGKK